jgi:hypothetical protein
LSASKCSANIIYIDFCGNHVKFFSLQRITYLGDVMSYELLNFQGRSQ